MKENKQKKPLYKRWWIYPIAFFVFITIIGAISSIFISDEQLAAWDEEVRAEEAAKEAEKQKVAAEKSAKKAAEEQSAKEEKRKEEERKDAIIEKFNEKSAQWIAESNEIILAAEIEALSAHFKAKIYVDELTWAQSSESEKLSFATSIGNMMQDVVGSSENVLTDIVSAVNGDVVADQSILGKWKIKR
ncbi:hypothetical protein [Sporosarcina sp. OR05]|uniref:hypothetical protein n=1 Tax=Sporosarcina sp. OR05 TaxID=2969819 RepID=UPI00352A8E68